MANNPTFTGFEPEVQDITRQREMAKMLLQKGMADNLQGQMVSGRYVGASPWQGIANIYAAYTGNQMSKEADRKQQELAQMLRTAGVEESKDILSTMRGREATPEVVPQGQTLLDDQGQLTMGSQRATAAVAPDLQSAYAKAIGARSPQAQALAPILAKQLMREPKWEKIEQLDQKTGNTITGMVDVNSPNPESTFRAIGVSKPALSQKDMLELRDRGILGGGGMSSSVMPVASSQGGGQGGGQGGAKATSDVKFMPSTMPTYEYNPNLSPQQNRELAGKFEEDLRKNVKNAKESFETLKAASQILSSGLPSSGRLENIATGVREFFGSESEQAKQDSKLTILAQKLTGQVPRFEGPQSNVDVAMYQAAAGDLGNPNKTIGARLAAAQTLIDLNKKYYPNGDWDSIDLSGPVTTRQTFTKGEKRFDPVTFRQGLSPKDQEAFDWVRKNPNDPRSNEIKKNLGIK
jgi:hypothetical protein